MKKLIICFFLSVGMISDSIGQRPLPVDTNKYRIDLPDFWKPGNRVWKILSDKLPIVCDEIKDKELCGDHCNPGYTIEFEMSEPVIYDYVPVHISSVYPYNQFSKPTENWDIQTHYGFECSLLLRDKDGRLLTRFILVDTNEVWRKSNRVTLAAYSPPPMPVNTVRRSRNSRSGSIDAEQNFFPILPQMGQEGETPFAFINKNQDKLLPTYWDIFLIVDRKINSW